MICWRYLRQQPNPIQLLQPSLDRHKQALDALSVKDRRLRRINLEMRDIACIVRSNNKGGDPVAAR